MDNGDDNCQIVDVGDLMRSHMVLSIPTVLHMGSHASATHWPYLARDAHFREESPLNANASETVTCHTMEGP